MKNKNLYFTESKKLLLNLTLVFGLFLGWLVLTNLLQDNKASALNNSFYIDCSASTNGSGTIGSPWNTPESLFDHQFAPTNYSIGEGDKIYIKRGTTCTYPIRLLRGSGEPGNPVIVTGYDSGPRPIINGSLVEVDNWDGQPDSSAVQLRDFDNVTIEGLELTNTGGDELLGRRQGIWSLSTEKYGARRNITIRDNYIHDIWGEYMKNREATAAINIEQRLPPPVVDPTPDPTWYENILIEDNLLEYSHHQGISFWGDWRNRPEDGYNVSGPAWTAWTGVVIQNNEINHMRGDGILLSNTEDAIVQYNTVNGFNELNALPPATISAIRQDAQTKQGLPSLPSPNHAGMFSYNTNGTIFQYNDVRGGISNLDGMAYDIDGGSVGTIIQYNYSQDNEGGFANICGELGQIRDGIIRYNISKNDGFATFTTCVGEVLNTKIYNNTIYTTNPLFTYPYYTVDWIRYGGDPMDDTKDIDLENNIFMYPNSSLSHFFYNFREGTGVIPGQAESSMDAENNLYFGVSSPSQDTNPIQDRAYFRNISLGASGFELFSVSAGVGSGKSISSNGGFDYFGNVVSAPFNLGAIQTISADNDGIDDVEENAAPNNGDGNGDGIPDAVQGHVGSVVNDVTNEYMTLQVMDTSSSTGDPVGCTTINSLSAQDESTVENEQNFDYPIGLIDFSLTCTNPGDSAYITIYLDKNYDTSDWTIRKYINGYQEVQNAIIDTAMVGANNVTTISYEIEDGGELDSDGLANGTIVDPIGPAILADTTDTTTQNSEANTLPNTGASAIVSIIFGSIIILVALSTLMNRTKTYRIYKK